QCLMQAHVLFFGLGKFFFQVIDCLLQFRNCPFRKLSSGLSLFQFVRQKPDFCFIFILLF
ncbi:hypothetical protein OFB72_31550, partial [Escherichia coli]|nr:hypothetical protein [Escherichia coli]